ncbi:hypothetical protein HPG69_013634 [Diceros bicornis minor]|uniref:Reversion-inducing cysteine-rich protein with Kazal EGF-like 1 domain-containing protein n=1 Tax=Diceros bicornis minor TaxID=77932 RepID=A0A7J7EQB8_DICBM|nr:hypothetical protein HPG69_013634 [Diceros bicornis minor]
MSIKFEQGLWISGPSTLGNIVEEVTHPCNPSPCPTSELCEVNRRGCPSGDPCLPYSLYGEMAYSVGCVIFVCAGCKLGEASDFIVRQGTLIQVPSSAGEVGCYKICSCGQIPTADLLPQPARSTMKLIFIKKNYDNFLLQKLNEQRTCKE